ncbi:MAG: hypothetical protein ABL963_07250 [Longimicrobiales bacterium]
MIDFQLFRLKLVYVPQGDLLNGEFPERPQLLRQALLDRPAAELRSGYQWHIGNVDELGGEELYFAVGRVTRSTLQQFNEDAQEFIEVEFEEAPYTHALVDLQLGLLAIARNSRLSPTQLGIARQVARLLNQTEVIRRNSGQVSADPLSDPEEFIGYLRSAYAVTRFRVTFGRPNPFDINQDFQAPMERLLQSSDGARGHTVVNGEKLEPQVLEELARSAAASGQDANAILRMSPKGRKTRRGLREKSVIVRQEEPVDRPARKSVLDLIREKYHAIRSGDE